MARTLKDIASELNVSVSTVSRVVNNCDNVHPKTRKRVLEALKKYNYIPNQVARSLKKNYTETIGIIIPDISETFFAQIIKGIDEVLSNRNYSIILMDSNESPEKEEHYLKLMFQNRVDSLVLATVSKEHSALNMYISNNIPVVFIDNIPNLDYDIDCVIINNQKASIMAVNHLIGNGRKDIAIITGNPLETTGYERLEGYKRALRQNNIPVNSNLIKYGNYKEDTGYSCMKELIEHRAENPFNGVYIISEKMTYGAIKAIREHGLTIPEDIALVGFDIHDKSGLITPGITSICQPENDIGKIVAELIIKRLKEKAKSGKVSGIRQRIILDPILEVKVSSQPE
ncbi:MAG: LacI family DNA-binding transcriptional regulator [Caldicoprobacterales bacterium]